MEKFRSRRFCILLYTEEDESHIRALEYIKNNYDNYAYICHDKDIFIETGELKKPHTHVVVEFNNARWSSGVADELNIKSNYIQACRNFDNALTYLIHFNDDSKHQYSIDEVKGNLRKQLIKTMSTYQKDENEIVKDIIYTIKSSNKFIDLDDFATYMCDLGYYSYFRRSLSLFYKIIENHNNEYTYNQRNLEEI